MNTSPTRIFALVLIASVLALASQAAESLSVLLQKGIYAEETEGNLDAAIKIYEGIVKEGEANRSVVAQAQYRLGVCQLKKGKKDEAAAAFRKLIDQFSDAAELVAKSRERLAELGQAPATAVSRKVWSSALAQEDNWVSSARLSQSGQYVSFVDWETGDLAIRDLRTGRVRRLTNKGSWADSSDLSLGGVFSPDGEQIAYSWYNAMKDIWELRVLAVNDPKPRVLVQLETNRWIELGDWSPNGKSIAVFDSNGKGITRRGSVSLISVSDGVAQPVLQLRTTDVSTLRFSPNGQFLAYSYHVKEGDSDVALVKITDGTQIPLVEHPAIDRVVGWTPDGNGLLVSSDRRRSTDLWLLPLSEGKPAGSLVLVKPDLDHISPLGLTQTGGFYYGVATGMSALYEVAVDLSAGRVLSGPKEIPSRLNVSKSTSGKRLSPDGRFLAFSNRRGSQWSYHLEDLRTGQIGEIPIRGDGRRFYPRWSADSQYFFVPGFSYDSRNGLFLFNRVTGVASALTVAEAGLNVEYGWFGFDNGTARYFIKRPDQKGITLVWHDVKTGAKREDQIGNLPDTTNTSYPSFMPSPDGKSLFYIQPRQNGSGSATWFGIRRDFATGKDLEFIRSTNRIAFSCDVGTDGFGHASKPDLPTVLLSVWKSVGLRIVKGIDLTENSAKERFSVELPDGVAELWPHWFGDRLELLFTKESPAGGQPTVELWAILGEKNEIKKTEITMPGMRIVGNYGQNHILLEKAGTGLNEIWVMENFLPQIAAGK